jgi:Tfp pilus assembly protein PilO
MKDIKSIQIKNTINIFLNRYFNIVAFGVTIIILVLGFSFLILPKYKQIGQEIKLAGEEKSAEYLERQKYLNQLEELKAEYQRISPADIERLKSMIPYEKEHERLLAQLESIILKNGFLFPSLHIEEVESKSQSTKTPAKNDSTEAESSNKIKKVAIKTEIIGTDYTGLKRILNVFENNLRLMDIANLSFNPKENRTSLTLYAYYLESD